MVDKSSAYSTCTHKQAHSMMRADNTGLFLLLGGAGGRGEGLLTLLINHTADTFNVCLFKRRVSSVLAEPSRETNNARRELDPSVSFSCLFTFVASEPNKY